jgi:hypothetical protein
MLVPKPIIILIKHISKKRKKMKRIEGLRY